MLPTTATKSGRPRARILVIVQSLGVGGTERAAASYAGLYMRLGCDVTVYGIYSGGAIQPELEQAGIVTVSGFPAIKQLAGASRRQGYDLIHVNAGGPYDPVIDAILVALKGPRTRVVQTNVFARSDYGPPSELIDLELLISCAGFWKWSAHSRSSRRQRSAAILPYLVSQERFFPPSPNQQSEARKLLGIPDDALVFGRVGQPGMNKWDSRLIKVCAYISKRIVNAYFVFLGCPPALQAGLMREKVLRKKAVFLNPSALDQDLQQAYSAMDVFLHLSRIGESFGLVLVEAAQAGLPVTTLATPLKDDAQGEVVTRMNAGGEAWTLDGLAHLAIQWAERARSDPSIRRKISSHANQCYGVSSQAEGFEDFFHAVMSCQPKGLHGRAFCLSCDEGGRPCLLSSASDMRLKRQREVLQRRGLIYWFAFKVLYSPQIYRLYRKFQERRYLDRQFSRAAELRTLLEGA